MTGWIIHIKAEESQVLNFAAETANTYDADEASKQQCFTGPGGHQAVLPMIPLPHTGETNLILVGYRLEYLTDAV